MPCPSKNPRVTLQEAYAQCTALARAHYENFPVGLLVPRRLQPHVHAIYAFARCADDFADEGYEAAAAEDALSKKALQKEMVRALADPSRPLPRTEAERLAALARWRELLAASDCGEAEALAHPVFAALASTRRELGLPLELFTDLLSAFEQDVTKRRYADFAQVLDYCRRSANPVGRLVLLLNGFRDPERLALSDSICTALQLANFWQDIAVDLKKDRIYLPQDEMAQFGVQEGDLAASCASTNLRRLVAFQVERTAEIFKAGEPLTRALPWPLRWEIRFTWRGGTGILEKIRDQDYDTLASRPKLSRTDFLRLGFVSLVESAAG